MVQYIAQSTWVGRFSLNLTDNIPAKYFTSLKLTTRKTIKPKTTRTYVNSPCQTLLLAPLDYPKCHWKPRIHTLNTRKVDFPNATKDLCSESEITRKLANSTVCPAVVFVCNGTLDVRVQRPASLAAATIAANYDVRWGSTGRLLGRQV